MSDFTVIDIETTGDLPWRGDLVALGLGTRVYKPKPGRAAARMAMSKRGATLVAHTNYDLRWLCLDGAVLGDGVHYHDTKVMAWMDDAAQELDLESLVRRYCGIEIVKPIRVKQGVVLFDLGVWEGLEQEELVAIEDVPWDVMEAYNRSDLDAEAALYAELRDRLKRRGIWQQFLEEEAPFSKLLIEMEVTGLPFDRERAQKLLRDTNLTIANLRKRLVHYTGAIDFNPSSGDQVARFLYTELWSQKVKFEIPRLNGISPEEKMAKVKAIAPPGVDVQKVGRDYAYGVQWLHGMGLPVPKEKKPGKRPTVNRKKLDVLYGQIPWVEQYCAFRKEEKLAGYLVDWIDRWHEGKLHGRFDQSGTITGRLAGREPNLQQVSKESDVRTLFRGDLIVGDYGQLEARLAAHFSGDETMLEIFRDGHDLYGVLAAEAWGGSPDKENENRPLAKVVWLASQYGARGDTLAQTMAEGGVRGYSGADANRLLAEIQRTVPRMFEWREEVIEQARIDGYVTTIGGRPRQLADIRSAAWQLRYTAERQAVNTFIQGSAADIVRRAMLRLRAEVPLDVARICLQVHDEILLVRMPGWDDEWFEDIVTICETEFGYDLDVPLTFEASIAESWADKA